MNLSSSSARDQASRIDALLQRPERGIRAAALRREMGSSMQEQVGIFRNEAGLTKGLEALQDMKERYLDVSVQDKGSVFNTDLVSALELDNMLDLAETMTAGSLARRESRGAHARLDFPNRDDENWLKHTLAFYTPDGPRLDYNPVTITEWQPQARSY